MELARKEDVVALHAQSLHPAGLSQNVGAVASAGNAVMIDNVSS
jgi:hypothetical protein